MSCLERVRCVDGSKMVQVENIDGVITRASLLALDGPTPAPGDWVVVHSGYVIDRLDADEAERTVEQLRLGALLSESPDNGGIS
ncbi:MAG: HypC/HybG/HupF family hydrogenase formation chaperone [Acidimicrobiales bacterium]